MSDTVMDRITNHDKMIEGMNQLTNSMREFTTCLEHIESIVDDIENMIKFYINQITVVENTPCFVALGSSHDLMFDIFELLGYTIDLIISILERILIAMSEWMNAR